MNIHLYWSTKLISILISIYISNHFVIACNIQIVITCYVIVLRPYYCWVYFYLMVKSVKSFVKIESRLQIALFFLFYRKFPSTPPPSLILTPTLICFTYCSNSLGSPVYSGPNSILTSWEGEITLPLQVELSGKPKTFCCFFIEFLWIYIKFGKFSKKKKKLHSLAADQR